MADSPWDMWSAVGTGAAVVVALVVSGHATWTTRRADKDRAQLAAAKMLSPLDSLERKAAYLFAWFAFGDSGPNQPVDNALKALEELDAMAKAITIDDLYPLLKLPSHTAKRSARALGLIQSFVGDAQATLAHPNWIGTGATDKAAYYKRWFVMLSEIKDHLTVAVNVCETAASTGAPRPSSEEMYG